MRRACRHATLMHRAPWRRRRGAVTAVLNPVSMHQSLERFTYGSLAVMRTFLILVPLVVDVAFGIKTIILIPTCRASRATGSARHDHDTPAKHLEQT
eukprot:2720977-Prymnesium_polylepis.2